MCAVMTLVICMLFDGGMLAVVLVFRRRLMIFWPAVSHRWHPYSLWNVSYDAAFPHNGCHAGNGFWQRDVAQSLEACCTAMKTQEHKYYSFPADSTNVCDKPCTAENGCCVSQIVVTRLHTIYHGSFAQSHELYAYAAGSVSLRQSRLRRLERISVREMRGGALCTSVTPISQWE